jgi:ABC-2 type transport system permease protein
MSWALLVKTLREHRVTLILVILGILIFEVFLCRMILEGARDLPLVKAWLERPFLRTFLMLALGADISKELSPSTFAVFGYAHPLVYTLTWSLILTMGTGAIVAEVNRGTADLLLTLPLARWSIYLTTSAVGIAAAALLSIVPFLGLMLGSRTFDLGEPLRYAGLRAVALNFFALVLCVASLTMLASTLFSRRGWALGAIVGLLIFSDFINLLAALWKPAEYVAFLSLLHYYRPLAVLLKEAPPAWHLLVLFGVALAAWLAGLLVFTRRDIPAT